MSRTILPIVFLSLAALVSPGAVNANDKGGSFMAAAAEALVARLPQERMYRAAGFFGPVVKKYQPVLWAFQEEYEKSSNKAAVIVKYQPQVDAALADARAMRVSPRYEAEKADYLRSAEAFATALRLIVKTMR